MSTPPRVAETFQEIFCAQYGVPTDRYSLTVLRLTLYPHARWLAELSPPEFLTPDRTFIARVGTLTRWRSFPGEVDAFQRMPANLRFWRRGLRLRVSVARMRVLFSEVMGGATSAGPNASPRDETRRASGSLATPWRS